MKDQAAEASIAAAAQKFAFGGGGVAVLGGLNASDIAAFGGLGIAVIGVLVQWYYKRKSDKRGAESDRREAEEHEARMASMRGQVQK